MGDPGKHSTAHNRRRRRRRRAMAETVAQGAVWALGAFLLALVLWSVATLNACPEPADPPLLEVTDGR